MNEKNKVKLALVGAGGRGMCYGQYALNNPHEVEFVAVAEPRDYLKENFAKAHGISPDMTFNNWDELFAQPKVADGIIIATQDKQHVEPALKAMECGYKFILLEKPISPDLNECIALNNEAKKHGVNIQVAHVLRYGNFYSELKKIIDSGIIGDVININHTEGVGYQNYTHSFVRGDWNVEAESSPMILAKSCHDMDLLLYLTGRNCKSISSFASLIHFTKENAPEGSADRCIRCRVKHQCPFNAAKLYDDPAWYKAGITKDGFATKEEGLAKGRYGRCVYRCENDVVDNQVVNVLFDNDTTASFTMTAHIDGRRTYIAGTRGSIYATLADDTIIVEELVTGHITTHKIAHGTSGHSGADENIMRDFTYMVANESEGRTDISVSVQSHVMCFAAEISRHENRIVSLDELMGE